MTSSRNEFFVRVRQAVADGNRAGAAAPLPVRGDIGLQTTGADIVQSFCDALKAAGGQAHVTSRADAASQVVELVQAEAARHVLLGRGAVLDGLNLAPALGERGLEVHVVDQFGQPASRDVLFSADVGISGALFAVAETGSLLVASGPSEPRSLTLLPPVHIAVVSREQLVADLFDLFGLLEARKVDLPANLTLITGPSKTGDIELKLVTGVHGPGEVHAVIVTS
jgi:L-lactate dehydrogenase complex protein LldG